MSPRLDDPSQPLPIWTVVQPWLDQIMLLGEGPYYEHATNSVRWTDIFGKKIYWVDLAQGPSSLRSVDVEDAVGVTADIHGDTENIIVAAKYGYATMNKQSGKLTYVKRAWTEEGKEKIERMRFNDGAVDAKGRFWAGSMTDNSFHAVKNEGAVFRLNADSSTMESVISPVLIPNGIGWSPVKKGVMYFTDSLTRTIWEFDYDEDKGTVYNKRPWFVLEGSLPVQNPQQLFTFDESMVPDGFQFDEYGDLWTAIWGAGMVLRIKDLGEQRVVTGVIRVPARCTSCCRFIPGGGMVITSASEEHPEKFDNGGPHAGKIFWIGIGVEGSETFDFNRPVID